MIYRREIQISMPVIVILHKLLAMPFGCITHLKLQQPVIRNDICALLGILYEQPRS